MTHTHHSRTPRRFWPALVAATVVMGTTTLTLAPSAHAGPMHGTCPNQPALTAPVHRALRGEYPFVDDGFAATGQHLVGATPWDDSPNDNQNALDYAAGIVTPGPPMQPSFLDDATTDAVGHVTLHPATAHQSVALSYTGTVSYQRGSQTAVHSEPINSDATYDIPGNANHIDCTISTVTAAPTWASYRVDYYSGLAPSTSGIFTNLSAAADSIVFQPHPPSSYARLSGAQQAQGADLFSCRFDVVTKPYPSTMKVSAAFTGVVGRGPSEGKTLPWMAGPGGPSDPIKPTDQLTCSFNLG